MPEVLENDSIYHVLTSLVYYNATNKNDLKLYYDGLNENRKNIQIVKQIEIESKSNINEFISFIISTFLDRFQPLRYSNNATIHNDEIPGRILTFPPCGEETLINFFYLIFNDKLNSLIEINPQPNELIIEFFKINSNYNKLLLMSSFNEFVESVSQIPNAVYNRFGKYEISSREGGLENFLIIVSYLLNIELTKETYITIMNDYSDKNNLDYFFESNKNKIIIKNKDKDYLIYELIFSKGHFQFLQNTKITNSLDKTFADKYKNIYLERLKDEDNLNLYTNNKDFNELFKKYKFRPQIERFCRDKITNLQIITNDLMIDLNPELLPTIIYNLDKELINLNELIIKFPNYSSYDIYDKINFKN